MNRETRNQPHFKPWRWQLISIILFLCWTIGSRWHHPLFAQGDQNPEKISVRISFHDQKEEMAVKRIVLRTLKAPIEHEEPHRYIETKLTWGQIIQLRMQDYDVSIVFTTSLTEVSSAFHDHRELTAELDSLQRIYPKIMYVSKIGKSARNEYPIQAVKISDHPALEENEPAILFTGVHHAREPLGAEICLYLLKHLCENYTKQAETRRIVNETEIWIVPVLNPDGLEMSLNPARSMSWWRKNCRDNNQNGKFDSDSDGVDLNRNYDFNWADGGSSDVTSLYYRGPNAFSESETRAIRNLAFAQNFVFAIDYHSFGESILYPWGNFQKPPDYNLILKIGSELASQISNLAANGTYKLIPLDARMGQSSVWYYAQLNTLGYIVETADSYYPSEAEIEPICRENFGGALYLLNRIHRAKVFGQVRDASTKKPLIAKIHVEGLTAPHVKARESGPIWGRYDKLLNPGAYSITFAALGYHSKTVNGIIIYKDKPTRLDIDLIAEKHPRTLGNY